ncbi:SpaA isopeptide-forming pilin-related protein [Anaerococcus obesiensis]|uniref:SpaA isopeptide-forming pilin-related protein n=2 Tax=Anaerococcus obesiensis TaxID=1287640 RepID=UPI0039967239
MKKLLRKLTSFAIALFMVLQVMLPAFATRSKAEELEPNTIKNIENLETNEDAYLSITDSQKIYDKKKIDKDESKFSIALGLPSTSSNFRLVKRNDLKLYEDKFFQTNEDASKEYWRIKDMLNLQGLDLDLEIIKEDQGYKILTKNEMENLEQGKKDNFYGENYSYIDFKILDDFDFNENGNQKLLNQDKLVFNLEFIKNISPDPNYNLFEKDEQGNWNIKNEGDIFALINEDKKNLYDTNSLTNDLNSLNAYKEERKQAEEEKAQKEAEKKAEEERKAEEEKKQAEEKAKEEEKKKAAEEKAKEEKKKAEEEKKAQEEKQKEENANFEKANKELKEALEDENNSIEDIQKLLTELGEKYNLSLANQEKLMSSNDKAIKALVEKDRKENFRPLNLAVSNKWSDKVFNLKTQMQVKASPTLPIPEGWHFDIKLGPYLKEKPDEKVKDLYDNGVLIANATYDQKGHYIRYKFITKVTSEKTLNIDQNLAFDEESIGNRNPITVQIQAAPKNNPVQNAKPITVYRNSQTPVSSNFVIEGEGKTEEGTYPYQLDWKTTSQKLKNKNGEDITNNLAADLSGAFIEWDIEVDTSTLVDKNNKLDFNKLNLTVFGSDKQGLTNISYRFSSNPDDIDTKPYQPTSSLGELRSGNSEISKTDLGKKLYIKVKGDIDPNQLHESYSIGFRINPDQNYIDKLLNDIINKYNSIPLPPPLKWLKGAEDARRFAEVPFNLVETNIPATFLGLRDKFNNERFYYDNTRTIVAQRLSDTRVDWYALDLIRRGENQDTHLDDPDFDINIRGKRKQNIRPKKIFYVPLKEGGYRRTDQARDAVLETGQYYPGTIISYEYQNQKAGRNDVYYFRADLKNKKKYNVDNAYETEGGHVDLFTERVSDQALENGYLAYVENPYTVMRINRNFDMVSCFNDRIDAPVFQGSSGIFLDIHEDPSGDYLISRLNESLPGNKTGSTYQLRPYLAKNARYDGVYLNNGQMSEGQAMEELMKKIYFYGEEVKKEYAKEHNGKEMHRLIEASMFQRVIHHFTDGKSLADDYFDAPSDYNIEEWKIDVTLTGKTRPSPHRGWEGQFESHLPDRTSPDGARKLKDNEERIKNSPPVQRTQYDLANKLYNKIIKSYGNGSDWNSDKADSVKVVFYSHTREGDYQELIAGRVIEPIEIDKFKKDGTKLKGAEFRFTNINTGQSKTWTSTESKDSHKLYLRPGTYRVQEITTPKGYEKIKDFNITVTRKEINGDDGPYRFKKLPKIHVNDGFVTEVSLGKDVPKSPEGKDLVKITDKNIKVEVTNVEDNLGKLEFVKKNKFAKLNGAEFTLRKVTAASLDDLKNQIKDPATIKYDNTYRQTSQGYYGEFKFEQIPEGYYVLEETKAPAGYQKAPLYILEAKEETVAGKNKVVLHFVGDNIPTQKENEKTVIQNKVKETEIKIRKVREENLDTKTEHLGLSNAKFTLTSLRVIDGDFYKKEAYTDKTKPTDSSKPKVDGQQASGGGYISFENLKVGEYILQENEAPKGYAKTKLYGWKLVVSELQADDAKTGKKKGDLVYELYEVDKKENINSDKLKKINLDDIKKGDEIVKAFQIGNAPRTIDIPFDKYTSAGGTDEKPVKQNVLLKDNEDNPLEFDLYKADYYGAIISDKPINKHPIVQNKAKQNGNPRKFTDGMYDYSFELHDLEFGGYYVLRERKALKGYRKAGDILLKVEAEAIANEGHMKVIVRNPSVNAHTGAHSIFEGIINYEQGAKLGEFSIKKVGNAIGDYFDENGNKRKVGLRRAYFRLYTADDDYNKKKNPNGYYEYIQKVTPGKPITKDDGKGGQIGVNPDELPPEQGIVTFDQLKPGHYVLEEYRGPAGYEKDPSKWYISVDKNGIVTKYTENPTKNKNANQVDYSAQSLRYKMADLDVSDQLPINRLLSPSLEEDLQEIKYDSSTDDLNVTVKASKVDTTNGERTINFSISPKEKQISGEETIIGNNIQLVFVIDRSKDVSERTNKSNPNGATLDKNINKLITDIVEKAKKSNANIDVTFIQYDNATNGIVGGVNQDLLALDKSITDTQTYKMTTPSNPNGEDVTIKDYLGKVGIKKRVTNNIDGNDRLAKNRDVYYNQITNTTKAYDKRIFIDISNFLSTDAKTFRDKNDGNRKKFQAAEIIWQFRNKAKPVHFDTWMTHVDFYSGLNNEYITYMSNNTANDIKGNVQSDHFKFFQNDVDNNNSKGLYVNKDFFDKNILTDDNFIKERIQNPTDGYLVKDGKLDIGLRPSINLLSTSAKLGTNDISNNIVKDSTNNTISLDGINLKKGESLEFSYTIDLKEGTDFGKNYPINKSDIDKGVKFTNNGKENLISSTYPKSNGELYTKKIKETPPAPNTYKITINPSENGSVTASKSTNINKDEEITLTVTPSNGFRLKELKVTDANGKEITLNGNKFKMSASNVTVNATFEQIPQQGDIDLTTIFTYTNQTHGKDDSKNVPLGNAGRITLQVKQPAQGSNPESWQDLKTLVAPYKGKIDFPDKLDKSKEYRLKYVRDENIASVWGSEVTTYININPDNAKNNKLTVTISNGNLTEIFNHDETGFRIPLRITKVNENKAALTGSQFQAKKILNGDRKLYVDILDGKGHKTGKVKEAGTADKDPVYHDEKFDGVSEATGEPGDNYFRELTPGIYELTEIKTPDGTYRKPVDDKGNPMKWYFKVFVYKDRQPNGADYMGVDFYFEHKFSENDDWNKDYQITDKEKQALIGKTIKGLGAEDSKFNKYIQVIPDDGRSNPARPDAPYKGINDAEVTNYKNKTKLNFFKKDKENHQNLEGAEFSLRKVKMETVEENGKKVQKIVKDKNNKPVIDETESKEEGKRIEPFDEKSQFAKAISDKDLGVNFTDIPEGTYILEEIKPVDGYKKIDSFLLIKFTENEDGSWKQIVKAYEKGPDGKYIEMEKPNININSEGKFVSVYNEKNYIDLKFQKIRAEKDKEGNDIPVNTSTFKLTQVDKNGKPLANVKTWQAQEHFSNSRFIFKELGVGRYKLEETKAIDQFEKPDPWYFNVVQDPKTYKLKIVFEKPNGEVYKSIGFTPDADGNPKLDDQGNPLDIKVKNYTKIDVSLQKLSSETDKETGKKLPLKDALFGIKKVRYSMDENSKSYEYYKYEKDKLKKYTNGNRITEFYESGAVKKFTLNGKVYEFDEQRNLTKVDGQAPSEADKADIENDRVKPDSISSATGRYATTTRSQSDGEIKFENLSEGIYEVEEIKIPEGYQGSNKQFRWIFEVKKTEKGLVVEHDAAREKAYYEKYDQEYYKNNYEKYNFENNHNVEKSTDNKFSYNITNTKTTFDLKWKKVKNRSKTDPIKSKTKFSLYKASHDPNDVKGALSGDGIPGYLPHDVESTDGTFSVEGLTKGVYVLYEEIAPDGYEKMKRLIVIQIYEDEKDGYKLKQKFYELEYDKKQGKNTLIEVNDFGYLLTKGRTGAKQADVDKDGTFYVNNESKPYFFYLSKGFMDSGKFKDITDGELRIKIYADPKDTTNTDKKVYEQTIKLSDAKSYKINVDGVQLGKDYLLEEVDSPDGYAKTKYKYRLRFAYNTAWDTPFVATLVAVLDENGEPLKNDRGNISDSGQYLGNGQSINPGFQFRIVNKKTEMEFTKVGKEGDKETPLKDVEFYLEKQDPYDAQYYPLTENGEFIKSQTNRKGDGLDYYVERIVNGKVEKLFAINFRIVTIDGFAKKYHSDADGKFKITDLKDGYYRIIEPKAAKDANGDEYMKVNGPVKRFRVVDGVVRIISKDETSGKLVEKEVNDKNAKELGKIINQKSGFGEFKLNKYDDNENPMANVEFDLVSADADERVVQSGTTDEKGQIHFKNLPYGYYWLVEKKTVDGYIVDTKKKFISLGGDKKWNVPEKNTDVSNSILFDGVQPDLESTSGDENIVYPNKEEAIVTRFKLKFTDPSKIAPGNHFTIKLTEDVDIDGIVKDNNGEGKSETSLLNIIGPAGVLAEAEVDKNRRTITYTFTDYVKDYTPIDMNLFLQLYPNRYSLTHNQQLNLTADIGENKNTTDTSKHFEKSIYIDYRSQEGYQDPDIDVSSYMLRLEPDGKTFTAVIYYNQWNRLLEDKNIEFLTDKKIDTDSLSVKTYKKVDPATGEREEGSHADTWQQGDLPDSYGIDPQKDHLELIGEKKIITRKSLYNLFGNNGWKDYDSISIPKGYLNWNWYIDETIDNKVNKDPMSTTYVVEIKGKLADSVTDPKSFKTHVQYYHKVNKYKTKYDYWGSPYQELVGKYEGGAFKTWSQFYKPEASGSAEKQMQLINFKNRIDFVKVDGGVKGEVADTIPDEDGNTHPSSIFTNENLGNALKGAKFKLKKDGSADFLANSEVESDENGRFSWIGLAQGHYEVWETQAPEGYKLRKDKVAAFTVDDKGNINLDVSYKEIVENYKTAKIKIKKVDQDGNPIDGSKEGKSAGFTLEGNNVKGWQSPTKYTGADGYAVFEDIPFGNFELKETQMPEGYKKSDKTWKLSVSRDGRIAWTNSFDDTKDQLKEITYTSTGTKSTNLDTKIVAIDKDKKVFRQYNLIKANIDDLKNNKIKISSPDATIKLNQDNTKIRLVALDKNSTIDNQTPTKDDAEYLVEYNNNSMDVSIKLPEEKKINGPVGSAPGEEDKKQKTYLLIVDLPYTENSKVGASLGYKEERVDKLVENDKAITEKTSNQSLDKFKEFYRLRLVTDLDFVIENIKNPNIYFKKVDSKNNNPLKGAEFEIQRKINEDGKEIYRALDTKGNVFLSSGTNTKWIARSDENGNFAFENIPIDGEYQIFETKAPEGYALVEKIVFKFEVKNGKIYYIDGQQNNNTKIVLKKDKEIENNTAEDRILVTNKKAQYPSTGGPGVWIGYTILGLIIMFVAVLTYSKRKDKLIV